MQKKNMDGEKQLQAWVKKAALLNGWLIYHTWNSFRSDPGFPDCVMVKGKRLIFAELKSEKGKLTDKQVDWIHALQGVFTTEGPGMFVPEVFVWRPSDLDLIWTILKG